LRIGEQNFRDWDGGLGNPAASSPSDEH